MARHILQLGEACPTLEQVRVGLLLPELPEHVDFVHQEVTCIWSWKLVRKPAQGARWCKRNIQAHGHLHREEDPTQPWPALEILVGQELEYSRRSRWRGMPLRKFACSVVDRSQDG